MEDLLFFIAGLVLGAVIVYLINRFNKKDIEKTFSALSFNALRNNSQEFLKLANETLARQAQSGTGELEGKKKLIDQSLEAMKADMKQMEEMIKKFELPPKPPTACKKLPASCRQPWPVPKPGACGVNAWPRTCCAWQAL